MKENKELREAWLKKEKEDLPPSKPVRCVFPVFAVYRGEKPEKIGLATAEWDHAKENFIDWIAWKKWKAWPNELFFFEKLIGPGGFNLGPEYGLYFCKWEGEWRNFLTILRQKTDMIRELSTFKREYFDVKAAILSSIAPKQGELV